MNDDKKLVLDTRESVLNYAIDLLKEKASKNFKDTSFIKEATLIRDIFPVESSQTGETSTDQKMFFAEPARLDALVALELDVLECKFQLEAEIFFQYDLTVGKYVDHLWEAKNKMKDNKDNIETQFKEFFEESDDDSDTESSDEEENSDEDSQE